jgi:hypothetical protein
MTQSPRGEGMAMVSILHPYLPEGRSNEFATQI